MKDQKISQEVQEYLEAAGIKKITEVLFQNREIMIIITSRTLKVFFQSKEGNYVQRSEHTILSGLNFLEWAMLLHVSGAVNISAALRKALLPGNRLMNEII